MTNIKTIFMSSKKMPNSQNIREGGGLALINWGDGEADTKAFT